MEVRFKFGPEVSTFQAMNHPVIPGVLVEKSHAGPFSAEVGVIICSEKNIEDNIFVGYGTKKSAHKLLLLEFLTEDMD
jgi:hypothetical protein